jgi:hypothetical protein
MPVKLDAYLNIREELDRKGVTLIAVSKTKPVEEIMELYNRGHRDFGENYVQELVDKAAQLPKDINWHFIGHLQSNKVKYLASFVHLVHGVDSLKLLQEINRQGAKINRIIPVLLQVHIAQEETKFGLDEKELSEIMEVVGHKDSFAHVHIDGLMGMASFTENAAAVRTEFRFLKSLFDRYKEIGSPESELTVLSMGMSADYPVAVSEGSTMVRIGSLIFGERQNSA